MGLSQITVVNPGDTIRSALWNQEIQNILNNPITLISPTTGPINFNLQGHTNFVLENVGSTPTPSTPGRIVFNPGLGMPQVDLGSVVKTMPLVFSTDTKANSLIIGTSGGGFTQSLGTSTPGVMVISSSGTPTWIMGSSGTILTITSSATAPSFQAPATLTLTALSAGSTTPGALVITSSWQMSWVMGSSGTILSVTSSGSAPSFQAPAPAAISGVFLSSAIDITYGTASTVAHGLGGQPSLMQLSLQAQISTQGYSSGDEVKIGGVISETNASGHGAEVCSNATNLTVVIGNSGAFNILNKVSGANVVVTTSGWQLLARAWK